MNLTQLFDASLTGRVDRPALDFIDASGALRTLTFGDIEARANAMAHELRRRGLQRGDRLCVHLANSVEFIDLFLACVRLGVIMVPMNVLYKERELRHIIADSEPKAVISGIPDVQYPDVAPLWRIQDIHPVPENERIDEPLDGTAPALIIYTSGTTGTAKGAVLAHDNLAANGRVLASEWRITNADRYLAVLPLFHVHGLGNGIHTWLISGCRMRLAERFDQKTIAAHFADFQPTVFFGVPTVYIRLLDGDVISARQAREIGEKTRLFVSGSAPLTAKTFEHFEHRFGHRILERYGMSEALMITSNPYDGNRKPGTVGPPLPKVSVRLVAEDGELLDGPGLEGEVQIKSPALFAGYWRNDSATAAAFAKGGWFRTGDLGVFDNDGYLTLLSRKSDLIISGGFNIYPKEIEDVLVSMNAAREAAVVGVPDAVRGEVPVAYVVGATATNDELLHLCKMSLASFKTPRAFIRVEALPRNALGKVQKHLLPPWKA